MNKITFIIGASGVGKTTLVEELKKNNNDYEFFHFDSIGVPSLEKMIKDFGSPENWQKKNDRNLG